MAHNLHIDRLTGQAAMVSFRENPWHSLGNVVHKEMTDDEVMQFALLNWEVATEPVFRVRDVNGVQSIRQIKKQKLLVRQDTDAEFGIVAENYRIVQNRELVQWMRKISGDLGLVWQTAGALGRGDTVWVLAEIPDLAIALGNDVTKSYMLMSNGHGNGRSLRMMPTMVRVVCNNTLTMALGSKAKERAQRQNADEGNTSTEGLQLGYSIRHNGQLDNTVQRVTAAYAAARTTIEEQARVLSELANKPATVSDAAEYWEAVFRLPVAADESSRSKTMRENREAERRLTLNRIWESGTSQGLDTSGSWYTAMQAAVEYVDHEMPVRDRAGAGAAVARSRRALFGTGAQMKQAALTTALEFAGV